MRAHVLSRFLGITLGLSALTAGAIDLTGAGATFPYPIYAKWAEAYKAKTGVGMNYQSIGSGGGIKQIQNKTVDFGATDMPLKPEELEKDGLVQFPTVIGGDVPVVNLEGVKPGELKLTGAVLADIYLGKITKWNDPAIAKLSPGVKLPDQDITVVHRSDGSGTSYIWCDYLSKVSPDYRKTVGVATSVNWPVGVGGKGNEGVSSLVKQTPGAIGYVELIYAIQNKIPYGSVQNASGEFVRATTETVSNAAAQAARSMPKDFRVSITNAAGHDVYPVSSFTWLLFYENPKDKQRARIMKDFVKWALTEGQRFAPDLGYAPLPAEVVNQEMQALGRIRS